MKVGKTVKTLSFFSRPKTRIVVKHISKFHKTRKALKELTSPETLQKTQSQAKEEHIREVSCHVCLQESFPLRLQN